MQVRVTAIQERSLGVKSFELRAADGSSLPPFEPGAHIRVTIPGLAGPDPTRSYSLVSDPEDLKRYEIAVLLVEDGNGGSAILHREVEPGDLLDISAPRNDFRVDESARHSVLVAGGIGITPILPLARELARRAESFEVHYVGRGPDRMAYRDQLSEIARDRAHLHFSRAGFDVARSLQLSLPGTHVYVCGPHSLIESVRETAQGAGIPPARVHFESFGYRRMPTDLPVELELRASGITMAVEPGRPLLEAIESAGIWAPADCRRGECCTCVTTIIDGEGDHRDHCLTPPQRSNSICTCVSWAKGKRLVLDI